MEGGGAALSSTFSSKSLLLKLHPSPFSFPASPFGRPPTSPLFVSFRNPLRTLAYAIQSTVEKPKDSPLSPSSSSSTSSGDMVPKVDKTGKLSSPRAARELALLIVYAACLEGSDPVRLFEKRLNARREPGYQFDKTLLLDYNQLNFGGPPVGTETVEEAEKLLRNYKEESAVEAAVLSAPPKLVYSKQMLRFTRKLLVAVVEKWDSHVLIIDKVVPSDWKNAPAGRIMELCILHMAMSEIAALETRYQIVINEAVDLAKRFCDGAAPRVVNGCLRTFVRDFAGN